MRVGSWKRGSERKVRVETSVKGGRRRRRLWKTRRRRRRRGRRTLAKCPPLGCTVQLCCTAVPEYEMCVFAEVQRQHCAA